MEESVAEATAKSAALSPNDWEMVEVLFSGKPDETANLTGECVSWCTAHLWIVPDQVRKEI
jgi:hypothetical protein